MGKGQADPRYALTLPGALQLVIIALSSIVLICVSVGHLTLTEGGGWTLFVAIIAIILVGVLFAMHVTLTQDTCRGYFNIAELVIHCVLALFYFIAFILEAVIASEHYYVYHVYYSSIYYRTIYDTAAEIAASVFCALAFVVLCVYVVVSLMSGKFRSSSATATTATTTTTTTSSSTTDKF